MPLAPPAAALYSGAMKITLILILAAGAITGGYAMQRPALEAALPAADGPVPQIVIVAKREHAGEEHH
jgi:hypothetical protein